MEGGTATSGAMVRCFVGIRGVVLTTEDSSSTRSSRDLSRRERLELQVKE